MGDGVDSFPLVGFDGGDRRALAEDLWDTWIDDSQGAVLLTGTSGVGKSRGVVAPILRRCVQENRLGISVDVPLESSDLEPELLKLLVDALLQSDRPELALEVSQNGSLVIALRLLLRESSLVVIDEFQRLLGPGGRPIDPLATNFGELARRPPDGGTIWLVANRSVDPLWSEPFVARELRPPEEQAAIEIVLRDLEPDLAMARFPAGRRTEVVRRLGANPRVLRLLGQLLRTYEIGELLGEEGDVPEAPAEPALIAGVERGLLAKAAEGLNDAPMDLLRDLTVLRNGGTWGVVAAIGAPYGDVRAMATELRDRFLLEISRGRYRPHPAIRESLGVRLRAEETLWQSAHRRAGAWFAADLDRSKGVITSDSYLMGAIADVQFHLTEAKERRRLAEALHFVRAAIERQYGWNGRRPSSSTEADARIHLLELLQEDQLDQGGHYYLAKLLPDRDLPGDLDRAIANARRATEDQDFATPWVLWIQLLRQAGNLKAAVEVAQTAAEHVAPNKSLHSVFQLLGSGLDHDGRPREAVAALREGAVTSGSSGQRLLEEALWFSAAEEDDELFESVAHHVSLADYAPQVVLARVLRLERNGHWLDAANDARAARAPHPRYLHLAKHECLSWLGAGNSDEARRALDVFPRTLQYETRTALTWLSAVVSVMAGDFADANHLVGVYLGAPVNLGLRALRATLLREWDLRVRTVGEPNPALEFPVLPPSVTGLEMAIRRTQSSPQQNICSRSDVGYPGLLRAKLTQRFIVRDLRHASRDGSHLLGHFRLRSSRRARKVKVEREFLTLSFLPPSPNTIGTSRSGELRTVANLARYSPTTSASSTTAGARVSLVRAGEILARVAARTRSLSPHLEPTMILMRATKTPLARPDSSSRSLGAA